MINGIKTTLATYMTALVLRILFISYNEYTNRYSMIASKDSALCIFDKKCNSEQV
jgi:hypothetical protein